MAEIDAKTARLRVLCDRARAAVATYGYGYDEAYLREIGELSVSALPALLEELDAARREIKRLRAALVALDYATDEDGHGELDR